MAQLFIVATPIGNLDDFSPRAIQALRDADYIACEDTRTSSILFQRFDIKKPAFSFHLHNEHQKVKYVLDLLDAEKTVAIISDAGTPGISDPGFLAARAAHQHGHQVVAIPGASAALTALVASGLPCDRFIFEGFLPQKKGRQTMIEAIAREERTVVLFESPMRVVKMLQQLAGFTHPQRMVAVCRELTKAFEEIIRGTVPEVIAHLEKRASVKGEIVVVIAGTSYSEETA